MNQGGEPAHDDYGLPHVDVEIPDDARELYRDVQAYYRELRALRRRRRSLRLRAPFRKSGMLLPLAAGSVVLALFAAMVLTMFSANPYFSGSPPRAPGTRAHTTTRASSGSSSPAAPGSAAVARLPSATITVAGKPVPLSTISGAALALVPVGCACVPATRQLLSQARSAGVPVYLVAARGTSPAGLARILGSPASAGRALVASDSGNALAAAFKPVGLTVLLVDASGAVTVRSMLRPGLQLEKQLQSLKPVG